MNESWKSAVLALCAALALALVACVVNPATGKRQIMLVSRSDEVDLGKESDPAIVAQFGLHDDAELGSYVQQLGKRMAAISERPELPWTFRVLDDPLVNAFALPGGYIYVTRGILAHFNSEAELVSVLGHEIGHVTARHSASQITKAQLAQLGLGIGAILAPEEMQQFGGLAETGLGLLFLKNSRDDERQADDLGLRYLVRTGYDPRPMADVFDTLKRSSQASGGSGVPAWLSTHPDPENRAGRIRQEVAQMNRDFGRALVRRDEFLSRVDGIVFGDDPRHGYFQDTAFYHPEMKFRLDFPQGWKTQNTRQAVLAGSSERDALIRLSLSSKATPDEALQEFLSQSGVSRGQGFRSDVHGLGASGSTFTAATDSGTLVGRVLFVAHGGRVFGLLGFAPEASWGARRAAIEAALTSFRPLTEPRYLDVQPATLHLVRIDRSMTLDEFARSQGASVPAETLAVINGLDPGQRLEAGRSYKVVRGGQLP